MVAGGGDGRKDVVKPKGFLHFISEKSEVTTERRQDEKMNGMYMHRNVCMW